MRKITTAEALAAQIQDGATIAISGNGGGIPGVALREGVPYQSLWLSVEQGVHNGMMLDDAFFG